MTQSKKHFFTDLDSIWPYSLRVSDMSKRELDIERQKKDRKM